MSAFLPIAYVAIAMIADEYTLSSLLVVACTQNISLEEGAVFEPLAVAVQAVAKVADLHANKIVAVFGAG